MRSKCWRALYSILVASVGSDLAASGCARDVNLKKGGVVRGDNRSVITKSAGNPQNTVGPTVKIPESAVRKSQAIGKS